MKIKNNKFRCLGSGETVLSYLKNEEAKSKVLKLPFLATYFAK